MVNFEPDTFNGTQSLPMNIWTRFHHVNTVMFGMWVKCSCYDNVYVSDFSIEFLILDYTPDFTWLFVFKWFFRTQRCQQNFLSVWNEFVMLLFEENFLSFIIFFLFFCFSYLIIIRGKWHAFYFKFQLVSN